MPTPPIPSTQVSLGLPPRIALLFHFYFESMYAGMAAYSAAHNWDLCLEVFRNPGVLPKQCNWSGLLASPFLKPEWEWQAQTRCPIVYIYPIGQMPPGSPIVTLDWEGIGRCGAQHLLDLGNVAFGYYRRHEDPATLDMQFGFNHEIEKHSFKVTNFNYPSSHPFGAVKSSREERVSWLVQELKKAELPLAVMAQDDRFAIDLIYAARILGLRVPEDIAILGTDDDTLIQRSVGMPISSVDGNLYECGWRGAELLHRLMEGAQPGTKEVPLLTKVSPRGVVVRQSTATFVCKKPAVTKAAMFVRKNFRDPISTEDVAVAAGVSLRRLQEEYPTYVGRSIKADIVRQRLSSAEQLLERTNLKLAAVASETGFGTIEHLCKVFRRERKMTPLEWRQRRGQPAM